MRCFLGGSVMAVAEFLNHFEIRDRKVHLFDTFEGFPAGTQEIDARGNEVKLHSHDNFREVVVANVANTNYDFDQLNFVSGPVEETLTGATELPAKIAYLRLDTDYYESTKIELEVLYPRLVSRGICTIDDYGSFQGARRATDEFLAQLESFPLLNRLYWGARVFTKP